MVQMFNFMPQIIGEYRKQKKKQKTKKNKLGDETNKNKLTLVKYHPHLLLLNVYRNGCHSL